jgi:hypothetical protein
MKNILTSIALSVGTILSVSAQLQTPKASPLAKIEQKVGLTDFKVEYSRPSKNGRVVFGDFIAMDSIWRTGSNENTKFTNSDAIVFGKDTLKAGTYALYTRPGKDSWELIFYSDVTNWGNPEVWDASKVVLKTKAKVSTLANVVETFSISFENLESSSASLNFTWDKTLVSFDFSVPTDVKVMANIKKTMAGPSANDYFGAANYYYTEKKDLKEALVWVNKAIELRGESAYWMLRLKSLIQADLGDKKGAIETATKSMASAEKENDQYYAGMNKTSIAEWSKK